MADCRPDIVCVLNKFSNRVRAPCAAHKLGHCAKDLLIVKNIKIKMNQDNTSRYRMKTWNFEYDKLSFEVYKTQLTTNTHKTFVSTIISNLFGVIIIYTHTNNDNKCFNITARRYRDNVCTCTILKIKYIIRTLVLE